MYYSLLLFFKENIFTLTNSETNSLHEQLNDSGYVQYMDLFIVSFENTKLIKKNQLFTT